MSIDQIRKVKRKGKRIILTKYIIMHFCNICLRASDLVTWNIIEEQKFLCLQSFENLPPKRLPNTVFLHDEGKTELFFCVFILKHVEDI